MQATIVHYAAIRGAEPSVVLVVVVWLAMRSGVRRAALFGFLAGLGEDVLSFDGALTWTLATTPVAVAASLPTRRFFEDSAPLFAIVTAAATLLRALLYWSAKSLEGYPSGVATLHFHKALEQALLNALLAIVAVAVARRIPERARPSRTRA